MNSAGTAAWHGVGDAGVFWVLALLLLCRYPCLHDPMYRTSSCAVQSIEEAEEEGKACSFPLKASLEVVCIGSALISLTSWSHLSARELGNVVFI